MRISVVVAAHNEGARLWRTVQSCVETCSHLNYEIVVADDASCDDSVEEVKRRFPQVKIVRHDRRQGASPTKALGADHASGRTLVFLDGHTKPEYGAIARLAEDVDLLEGRAVVIPQIPTLDPHRWKNDFTQAGHGYYLDLATFACGWRELSKLRPVTHGRKQFYESPSLIGCALAVDRELYDKLWGFDRHMRLWGVEDLDFGLKCWLMGYRILHDPQAVIGHRFREAFDNYSAPLEHVIANQLRMAHKNFTQGVWAEWMERSRQRNPERLAEHPEGLWAHVWHLFETDQASADHERAYLHANRTRDEFWYAEHFGLKWPRLETTAKPQLSIRELQAEASPSPPPEYCGLESISPDDVTIATGDPQVFTAQGDNLDDVQWSSGGDPPDGEGEEYETEFENPGNYTVTAQCDGPSGPIEQTAQVTAVQIDRLQYQDPSTGAWQEIPDPMYVALGTIVTFQALPNPSGAEFPMGKPTWTGTNGDGPVVSAGFYEKSANLGDFKVVTAKCGNTKQVNVIVFELKGKLTPTDDFTGRDEDTYGLMEDVDLTLQTDPAGIDGADIGTLQWRVVSGKGQIKSNDGIGGGKYSAGANDGTTQLQLSIVGGVSTGAVSPMFDKTIIEPDGGNVVFFRGTWHCTTFYSIGFESQFFLTPKDVSFQNLLFKEGGSPATVTGFWKGNGQPHKEWTYFRPITNGDAVTGCAVVFIDTAAFWTIAPVPPPSFSKGSWFWTIPWKYSADGTTFIKFCDQPQGTNIDATGRCTIQKGTVMGIANTIGGPSVTWPGSLGCPPPTTPPS